MVTAGENPFRVQRIHALPYQSPELDWEALLDRLEAQQYRGAIVGPHGHGKTTLMRGLLVRLEERGFRTIHLFRNDARPRFSAAYLRGEFKALTRRHIVLLDGAEQLHWLRWKGFERRCKKAGGLVITCHRPGRLPTLHTCRTSPALLESLLDQLAATDSDDLRAEARRLFDRYQGNLRDVWFALYDAYAEDAAARFTG